MATRTMEERLASIEGQMPYLATKSDVVELKAELRGDMLKLALGLAALQFVGLGAMAAIMRFLG